MNTLDFDQRIESLRAKVESVSHRLQYSRATEHDPASLPALLDEVTDHFAIAFEELSVAQEELRQQSDELARVSGALEVERRRYQELFQFAPDAYVTTDPFGTILEVNHAAVRLFRRSHHQLRGHPLAALVAQSDVHAFRTRIARLRKAGRAATHEWEIQLAPRGAKPIDVVVRVAVVPDDRGAPRSVRWMIRDHTERKLAERSRVEEHFRSLVQHASDIIAVLDQRGSIRYVSPSVERVLGHRPADLTGTDVLTWLHPADAALAQSTFVDAVKQPRGAVIHPGVYRVRHLDGSWRSLEAIATNLLSDPNVGGVVLNIRDVTERKALEQQLVHQAFHDTLTSLPNRALFMDRLAHALVGAGRGTHRVAVLFFDLDRFKVVNDSLGHAVGDSLLVAIGNRLRGLLRSGDTLARFGGDEFSMLLERIDDRAAAEQAAARIVRALYDPFVIGDHEIVATASIGIALSGGTHGDAADLLRQADVALYQAKAAGGSRAAVYEPQMTPNREWLTLHLDLKRALERDELFLEYQPEIDLRTGTVIAVEALARWRHPERGLVPPSSFIPIAEETGLIIPLGRWALREACRSARVWQSIRSERAQVEVNVNVSAREFEQPDLVDQVETSLADAGLDPSVLGIEITERVMLSETRVAVRALQRLSEIGVRITVDDFGTGYSSLAYLGHLPVKGLKIDRAFVQGMERNRSYEAIVRAVLTMARSLDITTTAEGVETAAQAGRARRLGCNRGQGFYFAPARPAKEIDQMLGQGYFASQVRARQSGRTRVTG